MKVITDEWAVGPCTVCGSASVEVLSFDGYPDEPRCGNHCDGWFAAPTTEAHHHGPGVLEAAVEELERAAAVARMRFCRYEGCDHAFTHQTLACDSHWFMLPATLRGELRSEWEAHGPSERYSQLTAVVQRLWDEHASALQQGR